MSDEKTALLQDLAALSLGSELTGDYPDAAFNETLDDFIRRARVLLNGPTAGETASDLP
ncbi:MAG: hypothetical protein ACTHLW_18120 [Verrucomicrobiota bacterium]